jgi:hypothetical protein
VFHRYAQGGIEGFADMVCCSMGEEYMVSTVKLLLHTWYVGLLEVVFGERVKSTEYYGLIHGVPMQDFGMVSVEDNASVVGEIIDDV